MSWIKPFLGFRCCCVVADLCIWPLFIIVWLSVVTEVRCGKAPIHLVIQYVEFSAPDVRTKPLSSFSTTCSVSFVCAQILIGELCAFFTKAEGTQEKTIVTADCCYFNPLLRRIIRFLGKHTVLYKTAPVLFAGPLRYIFVSRCVVFTSGVRDKLKKIEITRKKKGWLVRTWPATLQNLPTRARTCSC